MELRLNRIAIHLLIFVIFAAIAQAQPLTSIKAAGATFPSPLYKKWFANYGRRHPNVTMSYEAVGSEAGVRQLLAGGVDFGASDDPNLVRKMFSNDENKYLLLPSVVGAVVPVVNLPGLAADVCFTPQVLASIYLGKIKRWNDPLLKQINPRIHLPDLDIVVVHRADGSGSSFLWTDYFSKTSPEWQAQVGAGFAPQWPIGKEANGNDGVAKLVKEYGGSIGYVEFIYALQNHLSFGKVQNRNGEFVAADLENISAAVAHSPALDGDFKVSLVDPPGAGVYPIASYTWMIVPTQIADETKREAIVDFLKWMLGEGQKQAAALGYVALPQEVVSRENSALTRIH